MKGKTLHLEFSKGLELLSLCSALSGLAGLEGVRLRSERTKMGFSAKRLVLGKGPRPRRGWLQALRDLEVEGLTGEEKVLASIFAACFEALGRPRVFVAPVPVPIGSLEFRPLPEEIVSLPIRGQPDALLPDEPALLLLKAVGAEPARCVEGVVTEASVGMGKEEALCRALLLEPLKEEQEGDVVAVIEAVVDDMPPEFIPVALEGLFRAGAVDAFVRQLLGKKGRPAFEFVALCPPDKASNVEAAMLQETTTIGLRRTYAPRRTLRREEIAVRTRFGPVRVKTSLLPDGSVRVKPEFEDCLKLSRRAGVPPSEVWIEALRAAERLRQR